MYKKTYSSFALLLALLFQSTNACALPSYETAVRNTLMKIPEKELVQQYKKCNNKSDEYCSIVRSVAINRLFDGNLDQYNKWRQQK